MCLSDRAIIQGRLYIWTEHSIVTISQREELISNNPIILTLLGLGLIKINDVSANFNNPRPSLILNN